MILRGDIRWFRFRSPDKRRPVLVVASDALLPSLSQVPVIPLSTQTRGLPWEIRLGTEDGLPSLSVLKPEWIRAVNADALGPRIASIPDRHWPGIRSALLHVLGFER